MTRFLRRSCNSLASLPVVVVLPEPCKPAISTTAGAGQLRLSSSLREPITATSSSWTIFTRVWPGVRLCKTSWPIALPFTRSISACTTGSATSASSNAMRTSRNASRTFSSDRRPRPRRRLTVSVRRLDRFSNMGRRFSRLEAAHSTGFGRCPKVGRGFAVCGQGWLQPYSGDRTPARFHQTCHKPLNKMTFPQKTQTTQGKAQATVRRSDD